MSCIEPDTNARDIVGDLQASVLHRSQDLAILTGEDPALRSYADPEFYRQTMCAMRMFARNCGFNADT